MEIIKENDLVNKYEIPESVRDLLGEPNVVVISFLDEFINELTGTHILERIYKMEDVEKIKPLPKEKNGNVKADITKDRLSLKRISKLN
eukprot:CAMPEP_0116896288 /NCGR_PEP_ID=MMETSP0467-20121206/5572_1 /TAXON_ID=283647 /ORGANISM="Mesodinium pulex, Strain SPMC105" /LENGTH=88 /DNA_ID=CAMNT_0004567389 /DNA_START=1103 /DNA_END=1369 /DNA_ORIENTATION=+